MSGRAWIGRRAEPRKTDRDAAANGLVVREERLLAHEQKRMSRSGRFEMRDMGPMEKELPLAVFRFDLSNDQAAGLKIEAQAVCDRELRVQFRQSL